MEESKGEHLTFQQIKTKIDRDNWEVPVNNVDPTHDPVGFDYFNRVAEALYMTAYESGRSRFMNKLSGQIIKIHQLGYNSIEHFLKQPESEKFQEDPDWQETFLIVAPLEKVDQQFQKEHPNYGFTALKMNTEEWKHSHIGWKAPSQETPVNK